MLAMLLAVCVQAPPPSLPPGAPSVVPTRREWTLGGVFVLKHEKFLQWQPVPDLLRGGWSSALRVIWRVEVAPRTPALAGLSLAVESAAGPSSSPGMLRPRLQYRPPGSELRVGVELPILVLRTLVGRAPRPNLFVSGRF